MSETSSPRSLSAEPPKLASLPTILGAFDSATSLEVGTNPTLAPAAHLRTPEEEDAVGPVGADTRV